MLTPKDIPTVPGLPIIGSILEYRRDFLGLLNKMAAHSDLASCKMVGQRVTLVNSPELLQELLVQHGHCVNKSEEFMEASAPLIGQGLVSIREAFHRKERSLMASLFTPKAVEAFAGQVLECADDMQKAWKDGEEVLIGREMMKVTLRMIGKIIFGVDLLEDSERLWTTFTIALEKMHDRLTELIPLPLAVPTPSHVAYKKATAELDHIIYDIITQHRNKNNPTSDLISLLLHAQAEDGSQMSDKQIRDEAVTMLVAGHETTANALAFTFGHLAHNPAIYDRLRKEVDEVLKGAPPTPADLKKLTYLNQIWEESLRLYPPVYVTDREVLEPITLGGYELPKGELLLVCPYTLHRRTDVFPDPEKFDPERFTPEKMAALPKMSYMPFGAGHRVCIGKHLANMEAGMLIALTVQNLTLEPMQAAPPKPEPVMTLRPESGYSLRVKRR